MKTSNILLLGGAGLAVYYLTQLGVAGATVQFVFQSFQFQSLSQLQINVVVQNVSNAVLNLNAMSGSVYLNDNYIANVSYFPPSGQTAVQVPAASQIAIPFMASISILSLPGAIQNLINNVPGSGTYTFKITGQANINSLVVPFTLTYPVTL